MSDGRDLCAIWHASIPTSSVSQFTTKNNLSGLVDTMYWKTLFAISSAITLIATPAFAVAS